MEQILSWLTPLIEMYAGKFGIFLQIVSIVGTFRLFLKPTMDFLHAIVGLTPTIKDDELLAKIESSPVYKGIIYATDWLVSLKLVK